MNDSMRLVAKIWYRLYLGLILVFCVVVAGGCLAVRFMPQFSSIGSGFALNTTTLVIASTVIAYCLSLYWFVYRYNPTLAMFGASLIFALLLLDGMMLSHPSTGFWLYAGGWLASTLFVGMYGMPMLLGTLLLAIVYILMANGFVVSQIIPEQGMLLSSTGATTLISFLFWRNKFASEVDRQLSQLTGMLQTKEEQAAILIQSIADGVIVTNTEGKITLINRAAANMTGWTVDEAAGINVEQVFKVAKEKGEEITKEEYPFTAVLAHKAFFNQVLQLTSRDGKRKQVISLVISPVVTQKGQVFGAVAVLRDISEQRAAEAQRGEFISTASHEMRTPVAAIEGYLSLALNDKVSTIDSRARGYLEKAHSSTKHLGQLFQDLLTSAKAEDGRLSNHPAAVEMGSFLEQLVEDLRFGAQKKGLNTEFIIGSSDAIDATKDKGSEGIKMVKPLYYVYVDPDRIREVITNIFDNACKYTDQGRVSVGLTGNNDVVQLYIRDTGAGIPAADVPHLFQKFYRVDNSATRTIGGTGLGLFIARKIIELYQGRIWVESELGKGSTFFINLPRLTTQKAQELQTAAAAAPPPAPAQPAAAPASAPKTQS